MASLSLFETPSRRRLRLRWLAFHQANPHVYEMFKMFAFQAIPAGRTKFSARMIWQRMRWHTAIEVCDGADFKLNNNYTPYYARQFMEDYPEFDGFFETRGAPHG